MARTTSGKQEKIDEKFRFLCRDLNQVIIHTVEFNYGDFRFRVYEDANGRYSTLVADIQWDKDFGRKFKKIARKHGYKLNFDSRKGVYYIRQLNNKNKKNGTRRITLHDPEE